MSCTRAGTSNERTTKVSSSTPKATMKPNWTKNMIGMMPNAANVAARTTPALVIDGKVVATGKVPSGILFVGDVFNAIPS